ncbi:MAG: hlyD fusE [Verrucomicrobiales bacterium]|nr:hlyD fusE [Verrucomicrobiales bacterium]
MKPQNSPGTEASSGDAKEGKTNFRRPWLFALGTVVFAAGLFWLFGWMLASFTHETTDDAFLDAHVVTMAPKVAGIVSAVHIKQNQFVRKGEFLIEIDPKDFETRLQQKQAVAAAAEANTKTVLASFELIRARVATAQASAKQVSAEVSSAEATQAKASSDLKRSEDLQKRNVISAQEFETSKTIAASTEANLRAAREKLAGEESKVKEAQAQLEAAKTVFEVSGAQLNQAKADVTAAELDLSYTKIAAPGNGRITNKRVEPGDYLQVGQALFALVPNELWVTANFKETQLRTIRTNQRVEVEIDSVADRPFRGHIESIQSGSGARFSLLPPENAVGNFVKVVQRVPVKIVFDEPLNIPQALGPGMSAMPSVRIKELHVPSLALAMIALVMAMSIAWLLWFLTDPKRKGENASAGASTGMAAEA